MAPRAHVFCVPFPGAGHAVNMFNVATTLATPQIRVHVLVMSRIKGEQWLKATGQVENSYLQIDVLASGRWETWDEHEASTIFKQIQSAEFTQAINDRILEVKQRHPDEHATALIFNGLMASLLSVCEQQNLKSYVLMPTPGYGSYIAYVQNPGDPLTRRFMLQGIGGSTENLAVELGDFVDMTTPMFWKMFKPTQDACTGLIYSNSNIAIDGSGVAGGYKRNSKMIQEYKIGPILPPWYENALDDQDGPAMKTIHDYDDDCIRFLNEHANSSVVYIALGSHASLTIAQAITLVKALSKYNVPWVLLFRNRKEELQQLLAKEDQLSEGIVTAWAPQLHVLLHPAVKCVISHGGFGTMIEGVYAGQAFITSPVISDQFIDTRVMEFLGICVGTIAENPHKSVMDMKEIVPTWPDDGGSAIEELFERLFGSETGEHTLQMARDASGRLRKRLMTTKVSEGSKHLKELRQAVGVPVS